MRFITSASLLVLLGAASGLPSEIDARVVSNAAIDLLDGPDPSAEFRCGFKTYTGRDIYLAAQHGTNLRIAGETRGANRYPHPFPYDNSKGNKLSFSKDCPADESRYEFPLVQGGPFDFGKNNANQGSERVIFYYEDGEISDDGNPLVYFCGLITHSGSGVRGGFVMC